MKTGYLFVLVLFIALAIPLFAAQALVNPVSEFSAISIINSQEEVVIESDLYMTVDYEILAIEPVKYKQRWLPLYSDGYNGKITTTLKSNIPSGKIYNRIQRRIRSPV